jgi:hypothetical protein
LANSTPPTIAKRIVMAANRNESIERPMTSKPIARTSGASVPATRAGQSVSTETTASPTPTAAATPAERYFSWTISMPINPPGSGMNMIMKKTMVTISPLIISSISTPRNSLDSERKTSPSMPSAASRSRPARAIELVRNTYSPVTSISSAAGQKTRAVAISLIGRRAASAGRPRRWR